MPYHYDPENIFAKILRGDIPNKTVAETEHCLAFEDIAPQSPQHVIVIPKGAYVNFDHFAADATDIEITAFVRFIGDVAQKLGVTPDAGAGYRLLSNAGEHAHQEVPHLHIHLCAGRPLGPLLPSTD